MPIPECIRRSLWVFAPQFVQFGSQESGRRCKADAHPVIDCIRYCVCFVRGLSDKVLAVGVTSFFEYQV